MNEQKRVGPEIVGECEHGSPRYRDSGGGSWVWCLEKHKPITVRKDTSNAK